MKKSIAKITGNKNRNALRLFRAMKDHTCAHSQKNRRLWCDVYSCKLTISQAIAMGDSARVYSNSQDRRESMKDVFYWI